MLLGKPSGWRGYLRAWRLDTSGVVAMVVVFCLPAFLAAAGVAVDLAQAYNIKTRLSAALDKAALAAGNTTGTAQEIQDRIDAFITANYPDAALGETHDITVLTPAGTVDIQAHAKVKTVFMNIFGQEYMDVFAQTIVKKEVSGLELVLVMDTTGSMTATAGGGVTKIEAAKTAANALLDILYGSASNVPKLYIGVVPFSQNVNVSTDYSSWTNADSYDWGPSPSAWQGCVEARYASGEDVTTTLPSTTKYNKYYFACDSSSNPWRFTTSANVATNGDFSSATGWTQEGSWSIGSGVATKGTIGTNIATNGDFTSSGGWTLGNNWSIASSQLVKAASPDLSVNGTFSSTTGWTLGTGWAITGGKLSKTTTTTNSSSTRSPAVSLVNGYDYEVIFTVSNRTAGGVKATVGGTSGTTRSSNGTYTETITAGSGTTIGFSTSNGFKGSIDDFTIRQLESESYRTPSPALITGDEYEVVYTVVSNTAGGVRVQVGGANGTTRSTTGTFTETITAGSNGTIGFYTGNGFAGAIDTLTVRNLSDGDLILAPSLSSGYYLVEYTIVSQTSGTLQAYLGGDTSCSNPSPVPKNCGVGALNSAPGTYKEVLYSNGTDTFRINSSSFAGVVDNVKIIPPCGASGPYTYAEPLNSQLGPNKSCSVSSLPMTAEKAEVAAQINALTAQGSTMINLGMVWGWHMLDPSWQGTWQGTMASATSPGPLPLGYNTSGMNKAIILMTDGDNTSTSYSAYGTTTSNITYPATCSYGSAAADKLDCKTRDLCESIKAQNVLVYTIALGTDLNSSSLSMLQTCATSPAYAFTAPTTSDLQSTFTTIANQLNSLYIVY